MTVYELNLNGKEQLKSMYSIYVIVLKNGLNKYFYIGQTGDRKHISARSPFLRLTGHLDKQESSTQNQIYKGIMEKILKIKYDDKTYENVEKYFSELYLTMYSFPIYNFQYNASSNEHMEKRRKVEDIENILINEFTKKYGKENILNKKFSLVYNFDNYAKEVNEIKNYIFEKEAKI
jgi:hypothetical protein